MGRNARAARKSFYPSPPPLITLVSSSTVDHARNLEQKKTQESRVVVATLLDKKLRAEVGCPSEKHDATRFRPYFERRIIGVKSISSPRYLQSDIYIHRPQDATIHAQTEAVPVSAAKSEDPTLPEAAEGSTKAPAAVQEVMEQHAEAKQGLRDARISLLAPRGEAKQLRRRELEASQITRDCASKGFVDCLAQGRIAEVERTSKHAQQEQERSLARTETRLEVFTEAFERKELETQDQVPDVMNWKKEGGRGRRGQRMHH